MWKVLLMISAVVLIGSGVFSYMNKNTLDTTRVTRAQKQKDLNKLQDQVAGKKVELASTEDETKKLKAEFETLKTELAQATLKSSNNELELANLTMEEKTTSEALVKAQKFMEKVPDINKLKQEMAERANLIQEEEVAIASLRGQVSASEERKQELDGVRAEMQAVEDDRQKGIIRGEFATTVKKAFNNWGFVVIDAGDNQGVVNKAQLDVLRRGQPICKLLVTAVEPGEAVAEVISGSLQPGQAIQEGDVVTKSTTLIPSLGPGYAPPAATPPAGGGEAADPALLPPAGGAPAGGMGVDPDPFAPAGGAAPAGGMGGGAAEPDPFAPAGGAMDGGAAPAPAPPAAGDDPFAPAGGTMDGGAAPAPAGGGAAPAPPAPPAGAEDDPFAPKKPADGAAPAPAPPAPAAGGTAEPDPFAQ